MKIKKLSTVALAALIAATVVPYTGMTSLTAAASSGDTQDDFILRGKDVIYKSGEFNYMDFYTESNGHKGAMIVCEIDDLPAGITAEVDPVNASFSHKPMWSLMGETWSCQTMDPTTKDPLVFNDDNYVISLLLKVDDSVKDGTYEIGFSRFHVVEQPNELVGPIVEFNATVIPGKLIVGDTGGASVSLSVYPYEESDTIYKLGEELDYSTICVHGYGTIGDTHADIPYISLDKCSNIVTIDDSEFDNTKPGTYTIYVSWYNAKDSFEVTVIDEPASVKGDVNGDGAIDSSDASLVLGEYAAVQTGSASSFTESQKIAADVNEDGDVSATDASAILAYYADAATGKNPSWK